MRRPTVTAAAHGATRATQVALARLPRLYRSVLQVAGRGGIQKRALLTLLRDGDVAADFGANDGYFTLLMSDVVGPRGQVHAFEPIGSTFERLSVRVDADAWFRNIRLVRAACSNVEGVATMFVPGADAGQASLARQHAGSWKSAPVSPEEVRTLRFDAYASGCGVGRVDFIKIDVEGAELSALEGACATIAAHRPLLCLELFAEWTRGFGHEPRDVVRWLHHAGYDELFVLGERVERTDEARICLLAGHRSLDVVCAARAVHGERIVSLSGTRA